MDKGYGQSDPRLAEYVETVFGDEDSILAEVRARQVKAGMPDIQVGALDGLHLEVLVRAIGARKCVEIGTLGGYSGIRILRGMAAGGVLYTFEYEARHAEVARESFARAGFERQARLFVGAAAERLGEIEAEGPFDLVFIDADKVNYPRYLAWAEEHLRIGGVVLGDNAFLWGGVVPGAAPAEDAERAEAMRAFNHRLARGGRFRATMLPTGEGLAMGVKIA